MRRTINFPFGANNNFGYLWIVAGVKTLPIDSAPSFRIHWDYLPCLWEKPFLIYGLLYRTILGFGIAFLGIILWFIIGR